MCCVCRGQSKLAHTYAEVRQFTQYICPYIYMYMCVCMLCVCIALLLSTYVKLAHTYTEVLPCPSDYIDG